MLERCIADAKDQKAEEDEGSEYGSEYDSEEDNEDPNTYESKPQVCTIKEAAKYLVNKKKVAILTGSGVSTLSGVHTHLGKDGLLRQQEKRCSDYNDKEELLTKSKFMSAPTAVWDWHYTFLQEISERKPNIIH